MCAVSHKALIPFFKQMLILKHMGSPCRYQLKKVEFFMFGVKPPFIYVCTAGQSTVDLMCDLLVGNYARWLAALGEQYGSPEELNL